MYGIYANIGGIYIDGKCYHIYIAYMDPMGQYSARKRQFQVSKVCGLDAEFSLRLQVHQDVHKSWMNRCVSFLLSYS